MFGLINDKLDEEGFKGPHGLAVEDKPDWPKHFLARPNDGSWLATGYVEECGIVVVK